jgi:hypothetical protein
MSERAEYFVIPEPRRPGRYIIVYAQALRGFETDSVDATSYPSRSAGESALRILAGENIKECV